MVFVVGFGCVFDFVLCFVFIFVLCLFYVSSVLCVLCFVRFSCMFS